MSISLLLGTSLILSFQQMTVGPFHYFESVDLPMGKRKQLSPQEPTFSSTWLGILCG